LGQIESFSVSDPDGSNKTTITRTTTGWQIGAHNLTPDGLRGERDAVELALAQNPPGVRAHATTYKVDGGPNVVYAENAEADPGDDTVSVAGTTPTWSRGKGEDFIATVDAVLDMPPLGGPPATP
jgi:hypothetical protein